MRVDAVQSTRIQIPSELFATAESSTYSGSLDAGQFQAGPDDYYFAQPLEWNVTISNTGDAFLVTGSITGQGTTACGRCLDDVEVSVKGEVEGYFLLEPPEEDDDSTDEADYEVLGDDHIIDLEPLLYAALVMDLPLTPLCREDCAGLCSDCGANLNNEQCDCAEKRQQANDDFEAAKNPFAVLRELDLSNPKDL